MNERNTSPFLILGLFAVAAAIVFHVWWPSYQEEQAKLEFMQRCVVEGVEAASQFGDFDIKRIESVCYNLRIEKLGR